MAFEVKEEAELQKNVEEQVFSQFSVNKRDYTSRFLAEPLNSNTSYFTTDVYL